MTRINDALSSFTQSLITQSAYGYSDKPLYIGGAYGFESIYATSWLAKAAVDRIPEDCFKKAYSWVADPNQISLIEATEKRLKIKQKKKKALTFSRLDGEAFIYFDTGQPPASPLRLDGVRSGGLRFVNVLRRNEVAKGPLVTDPMSPFYDEPEYYEVASSTALVRIHPSRIIRFVESPSPTGGDGVSVLSYMLQTILSAETARDNVAALTTEACLDIMGVEGLMEAVQDPDTEAQMVRRYALFRQMKQTNAMGVIDKDKEEYNKHFPSFSTLPEVIEAMRREVAAALGIPYALLFGRPGGLGTNGETELSSYYDNIKTMQENEIQQMCEPLDECVIRSSLGSRPEEIYLVWNSLWEMSDKERAEIGKLIADTSSALTSSGVIPADVLTESTVNALTENGSFPGLEQTYKEWVDAGGPDELDNNADELPADDGSDSVTP